jgi:endonuclease/exonuclease/phosphatase family metal-dependent hydrolase
METITLLTLNIQSTRNKEKHIRHLIHTYNIDILTLQETNFQNLYQADKYTRSLGTMQAHHSLSTQHTGSGTSTLIISNDFKIIDTHTDRKGKLNIVTLTGRNTEITIVNIHGPNSDKRDDPFLIDLEKTLTTKYRQQNIILLGDFNNIEDRRDTTGPGNRQTKRMKNDKPKTDIINNIKSHFNLVDTFRTHYPETTQFTHTNKRHNTKARLDRIYAPREMKIHKVQHIFQTLQFSDHAAVLASFNNNQQTNDRKTYWKLNNSLLANDQYTRTIRDIIKFYTQSIPKTNKTQHWEDLKTDIKRNTIQIAKGINQVRNYKEERIQRQIQKLKETNTNLEQLDTLERELTEIQEYKYRGAMIRSRIDQLGSDNPTHHNIIIEQGIQKAKQIKRITDENNTETTDPKQVKKIFTDYYTRLYKREATDTDRQNKYLTYTKPLPDCDRNKIDTPIQLDDIKKSIKKLNDNKAPGPDGLTAEFYKTFATDLTPLLFHTFSEMHTLEQAHENFNTSYITLIGKPGTDHKLTKNYRPISLLNTDYKILTKILVAKLEPFLHKIVHTDQQCSITGRNIHNHNHLIRDIIQYTHDKNTQAFILSLDQEKAFDRVAHKYLHRTLAANNIGVYFTTWIYIIYTNARSHLLINNTITQPFTIEKSVRQGCPLSPILYILTLEPLLECIRQNKNIKGLHIPNMTEKKTLAYADDTAFTLTTKSSIKQITDTFLDYGEASGTKINLEKTKIMGLGQWKNKQNYPLNLTATNQLKIYGITHHNNPLDTNVEEWKEITGKIKNTLALYKFSTTTIFARSAIINRYIIPKIIYIATAKTISKPTIKHVNKLIREYIFQGTTRNISHNTLVQNKLKGGINLHDIQTKINTFRLTHIGRIISQPHFHPLAHYYIGIQLNKLTKINNKTPHYLGQKHSTFYKECIQTLKNNEKLINDKSQNIYQKSVLKLATPLCYRIKWCAKFALTDTTDTFRNLHLRSITPKAREITYRLIYNTTPIASNQNTSCPLCRQNTIETESHIFLECPTIQMMKKTLRTKITSKRDPFNVDIAITLNKLPKQKDRTDLEEKTRTVAVYRQTIWTSRNRAKYDNYRLTGQTLDLIFTRRLDRYSTPTHTL